jgi:RluA family pseudouridine synthase
MHPNQKKFKAPPKRFQPSGLTILYEDQDIIVIDKSSGLLTVSTDRSQDNTAYFRITNYVRKGNPKSHNRIFIVHRLDRDTSGVLVFAKTEKAKRFLQDEWPTFKKNYFAVILGKITPATDTITSYLAENSIFKMYSVQDPTKGKLAKTKYTVMKEGKDFSLLDIELLTGRKNQIRVHLADKGCPVAGDKKYGTKQGVKRLCLHAASLTFRHPYSKEEMSFTTKMPTYFNTLVKKV